MVFAVMVSLVREKVTVSVPTAQIAEYAGLPARLEASALRARWQESASGALRGAALDERTAYSKTRLGVTSTSRKHPLG
jgi:hypothetical protein